MSGGLGPVLAAAAAVGIVHTLAGPDHYLPFVTLSRSRGWSLSKTLAVTFVCGLGHVAGSILIGSLGIAVGLSLGTLEALDSSRGALSAWLLLGFGIAYLAWGLRFAQRRHSHSHWHAHGDGTVHTHQHCHLAEHAHAHEAGADASAAGRIARWALFVVLVLGPCEALIPLLMVPAAAGAWFGLVLVAGVFAASTLASMLATVAAATTGLSRLARSSHGQNTGKSRWETYSHAFSGAVVALCGLAVLLGL